MSAENIERVRTFLEVDFCCNNIRILRSTHAETHVSHLPGGDHYGPEGVRIDIAGMLEAFPDLQITVEDAFDAGENVVYRFRATGTHQGAYLGFAPTGKSFSIEGLGVDRIENGKFAERWIQFDSLGLLQQIGVLSGCCP